jgi:RNA polymerase sigma factor (sigma-70 family)
MGRSKSSMKRTRMTGGSPRPNRAGPGPAPADPQLLEAGRHGDEDALRQLVEPHRAELHAHCYRMLGSVHDAEDALQDAPLGAWRGLSGFEGRSSLRTWLYTIATNTCNRQIARRPRRLLAGEHGRNTDPRGELGEPLSEPPRSTAASACPTRYRSGRQAHCDPGAGVPGDAGSAVVVAAGRDRWSCGPATASVGPGAGMVAGQPVRRQERLDPGQVVRKPSMRPPFICLWVASQRCDTPRPLWQVSGAAGRRPRAAWGQGDRPGLVAGGRAPAGSTTAGTR